MIFHLNDHLQSSAVDTDENGEIVQILDYYPFGDERINEHAEDYENDYRFTGKERDKTTNLLYYESRYYDSEIGRFLSIDPWAGDITNPQTLNKYAYTVNNPLKYVDPTGEVVELVTRQLDYKGFHLGKLGNHSFLKITPENPNDFGGDTVVTLGGGNVGGALTKGYNYPADFDPQTSIRGMNTISPPEGMTGAQFEKYILESFSEYDNDVKYNAFSNDDLGRNSNDLVSHFIKDAGGNMNSINKFFIRGFDPGLKGGLENAPKIDDKSANNDDNDDESDSDS